MGSELGVLRRNVSGLEAMTADAETPQKSSGGRLNQGSAARQSPGGSRPLAFFCAPPAAGRGRGCIQRRSGAEDARENRFDMFRMIGAVEERVDFLRRKLRCDVCVIFEIVDEKPFAAPGRHRVALDKRISLLARGALLRQRKQHPLRMDKAAEAVKILAHPLRIDDEILDDSRKPVQREVEMDGGVRSDAALDGRMRDIALMPQRDILHGRNDAHAHEPGEAGEVLGQHRIAFMRHRRRTLLAGREIFFGLQDFRTLKVADFGRQPLYGGGDDAKRGEKGGVPVARNDLCGDRLDGETHLCGDMGLDRGIDIGEGADGAGNRAGRYLLARGDQPAPGPGEFGIMAGELDAEGGRLGVDAMAAPDGQRHLVLKRALLQRRQRAIDAGDQKVARPRQLHGEAGVEHIRRGHALMHEARFGPDNLGKVRQEGDDVVLDLALDRVDASNVEACIPAFGPDRRRGFFWDDAKVGHAVGRMRLDLEPDAKPRLRRPDPEHLLAGVAGDHASLSSVRGGPTRRSAACQRTPRLWEIFRAERPNRRQIPPAMTVSSKKIQAAPLHSATPLALPPMQIAASGRRWVLRDLDPLTALAIEEATGLAPEIARLIAARGVKAGEAERFLTPSLKRDLPDPSALADMDAAAAKLAEAIIAGETCGVFGDYDVDGTCGAAILKLYFDAVGGALEVYLPDRLLEGYGPTIEAFRALKDKGANLIVTVDCGAAAHKAIDEAALEGLSVIVLDHHQMDGDPPQGAYATVNPHRADDRSGLTLLSAAGVVFMAIVALNRALRDRGWFANRAEPDLRRFLDLTALGLVCDVMPMTGLSRVLTAQGLKVLSNGGNPGLKELGRRAGMKGAATAFDLGFLLGPRINAAGRIGHARLAFDLLTTEDPARRASLAEQLHAMNAERQAIERSVQEEAIALIEANSLSSLAAIVVAGEGWHPGVVGIVAGRLKDRYQRPAIVIGVDSGIGKGSARSIAGVDIGAAIRDARHQGLLIAGGGHAMAAGLTADASRLGELRGFLDSALRADVDRAIAGQRFEIDALVAPSAVSAAFATLIELVGPFGPGNPEPVFAMASMNVENVRIIGDAHLACELIGAGGERVRAIAFRAEGERLGALLKSRRPVHVAGRIKKDDWRGADFAQFQIADAAETAAGNP